jgi:hypothetical protein
MLMDGPIADSKSIGDIMTYTQKITIVFTIKTWDITLSNKAHNSSLLNF